MRTLLAAIAALASVILFTATVPALWVQQNVVSVDGFVALADSFGTDPKLQNALGEAAVDAVTKDASFEAGLADIIRPIVRDAAQSLMRDPDYPQAWRQTLRRSHALTFAASLALPTAGDVKSPILDIQPLVRLAAGNVSGAIGADIPVPDQVLISVGQPGQLKQIAALSHYADAGVLLAVAAAVLALAALAAARRRSTTAVLLGLGAAAGIVLCRLAIERLGDRFASTSGAGPAASLFKEHLVDAATDSFLHWVVVILIGAAVLVAVGLVARVFTGRDGRP